MSYLLNKFKLSKSFIDMAYYSLECWFIGRLLNLIYI